MARKDPSSRLFLPHGPKAATQVSVRGCHVVGDGVRGNTENFGDLTVRKSMEPREDEYLTPAFWQGLDGLLDELTALLQPEQFIWRRALWAIRSERTLEPTHPNSPPPPFIQRQVPRDLVEEGRYGATGPPISSALPDADERLLGDILGCIHAPQQRRTVPHERAPVAPHELLERRRIAGRDPLHQLRIGRFRSSTAGGFEWNDIGHQSMTGLVRRHGTRNTDESPDVGYTQTAAAE